MKATHITGLAIALAVSLTIAVPILIEAVHALLVPAMVGVVLYLLVRVVSARLNRW
jgi:hypothetical protein